MSASRTRSGPPDKPRYIVVEISKEDRAKVLKAKRALKTIEQYRNVYIDIDRPRQDRIMESNIRAIANAIPVLEYKRGKVTKK